VKNEQSSCWQSETENIAISKLKNHY